MALILLIVANVGVFLLMASNYGSAGYRARELVRAGGNLGYLSLHGEWWRLFTATYIHAGIGHLFGNMLLLWITGTYLERRLGSMRFFVAYTLTGLAASLTSAYVHPNVVSVGASGCIAGLLGVLVTLYATGRGYGLSGSWLTQTIVINAVYSFVPSVDWVAHAGGFLAGLVLGVVLTSRPEEAQYY